MPECALTSRWLTLRTTRLSAAWASRQWCCCPTSALPPTRIRSWEARGSRKGGSWRLRASSAWSSRVGTRGMRSAWTSPAQLSREQSCVSSTCTLTLSSHFPGAPYRYRCWLVSCASPDAAAGSSRATSTQSAPKTMRFSTSTSWSMHGSRCAGGQGLVELHGVLTWSYGPGRLDKVAILGLKAEDMQVF